MEATVRAVCPSCQAALRIPAQWVGQSVKCKKCGAQVRVKAKDEAPVPDDTAPATPLPPAASAPAPPLAAPPAAPAPVPAPYPHPPYPYPPQYLPGHYPAPVAPQPQAPPNAFDFSQPSEEDDFFLPRPDTDPEAAPAPAPAPVPPPALDANGYPIPPGYGPPPGYPYPIPPGYGPPPGYPYAPPPGYPYPMPPGYGPPPGYPMPAPGAPGYPYPVPPGYPQPGPPGYAPPAGYAPPPGYGYPQPPAPTQPAAPAPAPVQTAAAPPQPAAPGIQPAKPGANVVAKPPAPTAAKPAAAPMPVPPSNEFKMDPAGGRSRRYLRGDDKSKVFWLALCLMLTAGLVAAGVFGGKVLNSKYTEKKKDEPEPKGTETLTSPDIKTPTKTGTSGFPRRLLFISVTKYVYLNPLTQGMPGAADRTKPAALRLAFDWRVPADKDNNQVFVLSDTNTGPDERLPTKNVVQSAYQDFFKSSRGQDRIAVYFGGHALEKDGKTYLAPADADPEGDDWEKSLIPLEHFYGELKKCRASQKIVIWDVCRYNPERGRVRPGSEPMTEALHKALSAPPEGVQALVTCGPGENALEFFSLRPDGFNGPVYSGSAFLDAMKFVAEPRNNRIPKPAAPPAAADPIPVEVWAQAVTKRTAEMADQAEKAGSGGKQTVSLAGAAPAALAAPDPQERAAERVVFQQPPKGLSAAEIATVVREIQLPPLKPGLGDVSLADFPYSGDVMKDYTDDVPYEEVMKDKEKYRLRVAVIEAMQKVRDKWSAKAGLTKLRTEVVGPVDDKLKKAISDEQEEWDIIAAELGLYLTVLESKEVKEQRETETKRWQANYDFAVASLKTRLAYMAEYNKVLGNVKTGTLPELDPKLGQDGYVLVASETLKSGKEVKTMAEQAQALFQEITVKYRGTPWAIQAKQEKTIVIGLNWKAASLKKE